MLQYYSESRKVRQEQMQDVAADGKENMDGKSALKAERPVTPVVPTSQTA